LSFQNLETAPATLNSLSSASINHYHHCMQVLEPYESGETYGMQAFKDCIYKHHRRVVDKYLGVCNHLIFDNYKQSGRGLST
jgi:hypothetical protein